MRQGYRLKCLDTYSLRGHETGAFKQDETPALRPHRRAEQDEEMIELLSG
jgi:hypothetical protein